MYKALNLPCYDVLVLGSGIAGLLLAHELASKGMSVMLACKGRLAESNTSNAQGGLAAVTGANPVDSPALHLKDTLSSGAGLTDENVAKLMVKRGSDLVKKLAELGVNFDRSNGVLDVALEGGHSRARVLHNKDASGRAITTGLIQNIIHHPNVTVLEDAFGLDLFTRNGQCAGVLLSVAGKTIAAYGKHTVLATGGAGQVFSRTTNPIVATADGIAMAYRAGAKLIDMEFVQFHPTALYVPNEPAHLISEAVRGAGAILIDKRGQRFAFRFHKDGELATRDIVARAIYTTMVEDDDPFVQLDMRPIGSSSIEEKFPNILKKCLELGCDPRRSPIPIAPAAHYFMGGIWTDVNGQTSIPGLYAIGECACTGLHGANRLASNSLLEGGVMALQLADTISGVTMGAALTADIQSQPSAGDNSHPLSLNDFRAAMFKGVGLERSAEGLQKVIKLFDEAPANRVSSNRADAEHSNIELVGWLMAASALRRQETRGAHLRSDFAKANDKDFLKRYFVSKEECGWLEVAASVPFGSTANVRY